MMGEQLFYNANIYTLNQKDPKATGVYVKDGLIVEVGDGEQLRVKYSHFGTELIDVQGCMLIPGLVDSHMHLVSQGLKLRALDFSACTDALQVKKMIQDKIDRTPEGEWIVGIGWNENNFPDKKIFTKDELDQLTARHPIFLSRICYHSYLVNSLALQIAGISEDSSDPSGGKLDRDEQGRLTGLLLENAGGIVQQHIPEPTFEELKLSLETAIKDCWSVGLTGCHSEDLRNAGGFVQTVKLFDEVIYQAENPFRVNELIYYQYLDEMIQAGKKYGDGTPFFDIGAVKLFADGAMGGRGALLSEPYADAPGQLGVAIHSQEELNRLVHQARLYDMPIGVHTIGDQALDMTLRAIEENPVKSGQLDRIIHAQVLRTDLIQRMQRLPLIVDIQPRFVAGDFPWVMERLGPERIKLSYAWKTMLEAGLICAGGSDAPIEPVAPLLGLHACVTRTAPEAASFHEGYVPEQKLQPIQAVELFTTGSAKAEQKLHLKGTIEAGKYADFTIFDQDLFSTPAAEWLGAGVKMTVVHGQVVYQA